MDTDEKLKLKPTASSSLGHDEVDFTSGFETQYKKEYSPLKPRYVPPPDKDDAWYRSWSTIAIIVFLSSVFLLGSVMLIVQVFTASAMYVFLLIAAYVSIAAFMIFLEVQSVKVR